ncbi:MAG TPA: hypothetical protein VFI91_03490 [Longimicrobiaceae bacterium]|nr:hypothetical protein [Longimicrobiaceae bacterium]
MWPRIVNAILGIWLMAAPAVLGYTEPAATSDRIAGPLIAMAAIVAISGATRPVRRVNAALGVWLILAPLILGYGWTPAINSVAVGAVVAALSLIRGTVSDTFGGGWSALWSSQQREANEHGR